MELNARQHPPILATEAISFQHDDFKDRLVSTISIIVEDIQAKKKITREHPAVVKLKDDLFERFGIRVKFHLNSQYLFAIMPFYMNKYHIFLPSFWRGQLNIAEQNKILKQADQKEGSVNLDTAKVTGVFSEYEHPLYMNFGFGVKQCNMTGAELAAVMLHEIGHAFNGYYFGDRIDTTNQVLAAIGRHLVNNDERDVNYIYLELKKINPGTTKDEIEKLVNGNRIISTKAYFKQFVEIVTTQMKNSRYDETAFEAGSDSFASRFGLGKELILGLEKLHSHFNPGGSVYFFQNFIQLISLSFVFIAAFSAIFSGGFVVIALYVAILNLFSIYLNSDAGRDFTYDDLKVRYLRIRAEMIEQLKDPELDKAIVKNALENIYVADEVIKKTKSDTLLFKFIGDFIFKSARNVKSSVAEQRQLEELITNDLFIKSAELRTIV